MLESIGLESRRVYAVLYKMNDDPSQLENEVEQKVNFAKMLIRDGQVEEGMRLIDDLEHEYASVLSNVPARIRYLIPYTRGRAYLQLKQPTLALTEFQAAVELAGSDIEARARSQNLLGATLYFQEQPEAALKYHLECLEAIVQGPIKDLTFQLSVHQNLANEYWALHDLQKAIGSYKEALRVLKNLDMPERRADIYWGMASAYKHFREWRYARLYTKRAIQLFHELGNKAAEAAMHINFAEILLEEGVAHKVAEPLEQASILLAGTHYYGLWSFVYRYSADMERALGNIERATLCADESIKYAEMLIASDQPTDSHIWVEPNRTYAEALQGAALVAEANGDTSGVDRLFSRALAQVKGTTLWEIKRAIHLAYASVLEARGDYEQAAKHYKAANQRDENNA